MRIDPRAVRERLGMNQTDFWSAVGVTQSGGSRYETGRDMPKPVQTLVRVIHMEKIDLDKLRKGDAELISYLRRTQPQLYKNLRKAAAKYAKEKKS
jgi:transcriptional regulator with XRE-family HTH domain